MTSQRNLFFAALLLLSGLIWMTWNQDKSVAIKEAQRQQQIVVSNNTPDAASVSSNGQLVTLSNDVLSLKVNTQGGDIESAQLLAYKKILKSDEPYTLLEKTNEFIYVAQSGLIGLNGIDNAADGRPVYQVSSTNFQLADGENELRVPFVYKNSAGVEYTKTFILTRDKYVLDVIYSINNPTANPLSVQFYGQLKQTDNLPKVKKTSSTGFIASAYRGAAYSSDESRYKKLSFSDIASITEKNKDQEDQFSITNSGWVAMLQHYFATAWIPDDAGMNQFYSRHFKNTNTALNESIIGFKSAMTEIPAHSQKDVKAKIWIGPELQNEMADAASNLDLTVDYGWFWILSKPLFYLLKLIHSFVSNWGVSIILITFVVRGIMYPLTRAQYTSMAKMKMMQPRIEALRERLGDDKQRFSQEMMALYKAEKVNPIGGCLPIVIQMPIFLALFYMLNSSVELRHAPFMLWIQDLSAQDPYYILPLLMGGTMFLIQKMSPTPVTDPMQQKLMTFMPLIFTVFFLWFPSGLVLYYTVSNLVTIVQQKLIYRGLEKRGLHTRKTKES